VRFACLGSGSEGNSLLVEADSTLIMIDCGFGIDETEARLARFQVEPGDLSAIVITHEHADHARGAVTLARKHRIPLWSTFGTLSVLETLSALDDRWPVDLVHELDPHASLTICGFHVQPFPVPHDAREPVQYVISDGAWRLGVLTDTGIPTRHIEAMLSGCHALVLECNHDLELLMSGPYPRQLKERIASRLGHLDNASAARLLARLDCSRLQHLVAAHLSQQNNTPDLARAALSAVLTCAAEWISVATQDAGLGWRVIA
jgi:phosphoribosyl 1,2-cyclic phosphodiesterase